MRPLHNIHHILLRCRSAPPSTSSPSFICISSFSSAFFSPLWFDFPLFVHFVLPFPAPFLSTSLPSNHIASSLAAMLKSSRARGIAREQRCSRAARGLTRACAIVAMSDAGGYTWGGTADWWASRSSGWRWWEDGQDWSARGWRDWGRDGNTPTEDARWRDGPAAAAAAAVAPQRPNRFAALGVVSPRAPGLGMPEFDNFVRAALRNSPEPGDIVPGEGSGSRTERSWSTGRCGLGEGRDVHAPAAQEPRATAAAAAAARGGAAAVDRFDVDFFWIMKRGSALRLSNTTKR